MRVSRLLRGDRGSPILGMAGLEIGDYRFRIQIQHFGVGSNDVGQVRTLEQLQVISRIVAEINTLAFAGTRSVKRDTGQENLWRTCHPAREG